MKLPRFLFVMAALASTSHAQLYWDGSTPAGAPGGGSGSWNITTTNWDTSLAGGDSAWPSATAQAAVFGGAAGTVGSTQSFTTALGRPVISMTFDTPGYTIGVAGNTIEVTGGIFSAAAGQVFGITGAAGMLHVAGAGNLTAAQSIGIASGKLQIDLAAGSSPVGAAALALNGGTLTVRRDGANDSSAETFAFPNALTVGGNATLTVDRVTASGGTGKTLQFGGVSLGAVTLTVTAPNSFVPALGTVTLTGNATLSHTPAVSLGAVSGAFKLSKSGTGTLTFGAASTFSGGSDVVAGVIRAEAAGALGTGLITLGTGASNATAEFSAGGAFPNAWTIAGTGGNRTLLAQSGTAALAGNVTLQRALTVSVAPGAGIDFGGVVSGAFTLTKTDGGTATLANTANSFGTGAAAAISVTGGQLGFAGDGALGAAGNGVTLNGGGLLATATTSSARTITLTGATNYVSVADGAAFTLASPTVGSGSFSKTGTGTLKFTGDPAHTGTTSLESGEVISAITSGSLGTLALNGGTLTIAPESGTLSTATVSSGTLSYGGPTVLVVNKTGLTADGSGNELAEFASGTVNRTGKGILTFAPTTGLAALGSTNGEKWTISGQAASPLLASTVFGLDTDATPHFLRYVAGSGVQSAQVNYVAAFDTVLADEIVEITDYTELDATETVGAMYVNADLLINADINGIAYLLNIGAGGSPGALILRNSVTIAGPGTLNTGSREFVIYCDSDINDGPSFISTRISAGGGLTKAGPGAVQIDFPESGIDNAIGEVTVLDGELLLSDGALLAAPESIKLGGGKLTTKVFGDIGRPFNLLGNEAGVTLYGEDPLTIGSTVSGGPLSPSGIALRIEGTVALTNTANSFTGHILVPGTLEITGQGAADPTALGAGQKEIRIMEGAFIITSDANPLPNTKRWVIEGSAVMLSPGATFTLDDPGQLSGNGTIFWNGGTFALGPQPGFTGDLSILADTLDLRSPTVGPITIGNTATLSYSGSATGTQGNVTIANGGTFTGTGALPGPIALDGALTPGGEGTAGTMGTGNLTFSATGVAQMDIGTSNDRVNVTGNLTLGGQILINRIAGFAPGTVTLFTYTGTLSGTPTVADSQPGSYFHTLDTSVPGQVRLVSIQPTYTQWADYHFGNAALPEAQPSADPDADGLTNQQEYDNGIIPTDALSTIRLIWAGDGTANAWDTTAPNFLDGTTPAAFTSPRGVLFGNTGSTSPAVTLTGALASSSVFVDSSANYTLSGTGNLSGTGRLRKNGTGSLTLTTANSYTGPTEIFGGSLFASATTGPSIPGPLVLGDASADVLVRVGNATPQFASTTTVALNNPGKNALLSLEGTNQTIAGLTSVAGTGGGVFHSTTSTPITNSSTLTIHTTGTHIYEGIIADRSFSPTALQALLVVKTGTGTQEFKGNPTYAGPTTINAGELRFSPNTGITVATNTAIAAGAIMGLNGTGNYGKSSGITTAITGSGQIIKRGTGTVTFNAIQQNTGGVTIEAGTLNTGSRASFEAGTVTIASGAVLNAGKTNVFGATTQVPVVVNGGTLRFNGTSAIISSLTLNGALVESNSGVASGANAGTMGLHGTVAVTGSAPSSFQNAAGTNNLIRLGTGTAGTNTTFDVTDVTAGTDLTIATIMRNGTTTGGSTISTGLTKTGTGTMTLTAANTYTGPTAINAGTLEINAAQPAATGPTTVATAATLAGTGTLGGSATITGTLSPGGNAIETLGTGTLTLNSGSTTRADAGTTTDQINTTGDLTLGGTLQVIPGPGFAPGTYTIFTYTGALTNNGITLAPISGYNGAIDTATPGEVRLIITSTNPYTAWATTHFGNPTLPQAQPTADPDGDGQTNEIEFATGTNPLLGTSRFAATIARNGANYDITWPSLAGKTYRLEESTTLPTWNTVTTLTATGTTTTISQPASGTTRLYRVALLP